MSRAPSPPFQPLLIRILDRLNILNTYQIPFGIVRYSPHYQGQPPQIQIYLANILRKTVEIAGMSYQFQYPYHCKHVSNLYRPV